ncbi:hypothetical protein C6341_g1521 [Phytophthora cactorum]|nr:hypothetical protein C6341_g1521 [Phytophthora cactorum]
MEHEWQQVSRRRRGKPRNGGSRPQFVRSKAFNAATNVGEEEVEPVPEVSADKQTQIIRRVGAIAEVLRDSLLLQDALRVIVEHFELNAAKKSLDKDVEGDDTEEETNYSPTLVGYGLGSFCASSNAVHQLGFLVALIGALDGRKLTSDVHKIPHCAEIFDPAMNKNDAAIAEHFQLKVIQENEHGRRRVDSNSVFFMPHCGKTLYQNVLACNWGPAIKRLVIIGNSFSAYGDRVLAAKEREELLLVSVLPYLKEVPLPCGVAKSHEDFARYEAAFNDLSVHRFPSALLDRALKDDKLLNEKMTAVATTGPPLSTFAVVRFRHVHVSPSVPRDLPSGRMKVRQLLGWTRPTDMAMSSYHHSKRNGVSSSSSNNREHEHDVPYEAMNKLSVNKLHIPAPRARNNNSKEVEASRPENSKGDAETPEEPEDKVSATMTFSPHSIQGTAEKEKSRTDPCTSEDSSNSSTASSSSGAAVPTMNAVQVVSPTASPSPKVTFRKGEKSFLDFHQHYAITRHLGEGSYSTVKQVTHRKKGVDVFSLGVVTYIMLCGYPPFPMKLAQLRTHRFNVRYPSKDWAAIHPDVKTLISKMLHVDPKERPSMAVLRTHAWIQSGRVTLERLRRENEERRRLADLTRRQQAASAIRKKLVMGGFEAVKYGRNGLPHRTKLRLSTDGKVLSWQPKLLKRSLLRYQNARSFTSLFGIGGKDNSQPDLHTPPQSEPKRIPAGARPAALPTRLTRSVCGGVRYVGSVTGSTPTSPITPPTAKVLRMRTPSSTLEPPETPSALSPDRLDDSIKLHDIRQLLTGDDAPFFAGHAMNLPNSSKRAVDPACVLSVCTRFRELHLEFPNEGVRDGFKYLLQQATLPLQQCAPVQPTRLMKATAVPPPPPINLSSREQGTFVATTPPDEESKMQPEERDEREHISGPEVDVETVAKEAKAVNSNQDE